MSGQDNSREGERRETGRGSSSIRWHLGVYCKSLPQGHLLPPASDCPSDSSDRGCAQPLKLQQPTDQILVIKSTDQLTVVELTAFAFMAPFEVNATLIIGQGPVCRIVIRVILILLAVFPSHKSLFKPQGCKNVCFGNTTWPKQYNFRAKNADTSWAVYRKTLRCSCDSHLKPVSFVSLMIIQFIPRLEKLT